MRPAALLRFFVGPMSSGKSTLALQYVYNYRQAGRPVTLCTQHDRSGLPTVTSRLGMSEPCVDLSHVSLEDVLYDTSAGHVLVIDEAQFLTAAQVDMLAYAVDVRQVDVDCFGLLTDFRSHLFEGTKRLLEISDQTVPLQLDVSCACSAPARLAARMLDGAPTLVGDVVSPGNVGNTDDGYVPMCRACWFAKVRNS